MTDAKMQPMDAGAREGDGVMHVNHPRLAYGIEQLISEVQELFPETSYETLHVDGRNAALGVVFDTSMITDEDEITTLNALMNLVDVDERVAEAFTDFETKTVMIRLHGNPRTQDLRDSFNLAAALTELRDSL